MCYFLKKWWWCFGLLCCYVEAGILPLMFFPKSSTPLPAPQSTGNNTSNVISPTIAHRFAGYIEYQPNGTITLRSDSLENSTNWQNLLLFKTILKAIKVAAPFASIEATKDAQAPKINIKIYGEGIEHKFPPFLERIIQRIQTYFSVYRYSDTSRQPTSSSTSSSTVITYGHFDDDAFNENHLTTTTTANDDQHTEFIEDYGTSDYPSTTAFVGSNLETAHDDYNEFISIGETNDGFITVGED